MTLPDVTNTTKDVLHIRPTGRTEQELWKGAGSTYIKAVWEFAKRLKSEHPERGTEIDVAFENIRTYTFGELALGISL